MFVISRLVATLAIASVAAIAAPVDLPLLNISALVASAAATHPALASGVPATSIEFTQCESVGNVSKITVSPCEGGNGALDSPCEFSYGSNYTITLDFTSTISSTAPRNNLIAKDSSLPGKGSYPYSGQSFNGCSYTECPVEADTPSTYTYTLKTLKSNFEALTFNVTDTLSGPSFICAGFPVKFNL